MKTIHQNHENGMDTDDLTRGETATSLYLYLMQGREIPEPVRKRYGFDEDYRMLQRINGMDHGVYERERRTGKLPDAAMVEARLARSVERAFESLCRRPPDDYLEMLDRELETLGAMAWSQDCQRALFCRPDFFAKYGIDTRSPRGEQLRQIEKAYRELDARCVRMTGRKAYADGLFDAVKAREPAPCKGQARRGIRLKQAGKPKGWKTGL